MNFGVGLEIDSEAYKKARLIQELFDDLGEFVSSNDFGSGIEHYTIGVVCIFTRPGYEEWYKERKPRFRNEQKIKALDGESILLKKSYSYDIKFDNEQYHEFVSATDQESRKILARRIIDSFANLEKLPKHVKDFDRASFVKGVEGYLSGCELV